MSDKMARSAASLTDSEAALSASVVIPSAAQLTLVRHPADGPIEGTAATPLDRGPDLGLAGPPVGRPRRAPC